MYRNKALISLLLVLFVISFVGCYTHQHCIGKGAQGSQKAEKKVWYAFWGLLPINKIDGGKLAGGATDYNIKTSTSIIDVLIGLVTGMATIQPRTVTVTK